MKTPKNFQGVWQIVDTEVWARDALDLMGPAQLTFASDGLGKLRMIAVQGELDCRFEGDRVEFSWLGDDDGTPASGRGWAHINKDGQLRGRIYFHMGDESGFVARRAGKSRSSA